jgi:hypothetical protein
MTFQRNMLPRPSVLKNKPIRSATQFMLVSCVAYSSALNMEATCSSKQWLTVNRLHGIYPLLLCLYWLEYLLSDTEVYVFQFTCETSYYQNSMDTAIKQNSDLNSMPKDLLHSVSSFDLPQFPEEVFLFPLPL